MRIGSVPFINAKPLIFGLEHSARVELTLATPRLLAGQLASGTIKTALLSSIEAFSRDDYRYIPGISISSDGPVASVLLFLNTSLSAVKTMGLDAGSLSSSALAKILCKRLWQITPEFRSITVSDELDLRKADAVMVIGDKALSLSQGSRRSVDLGAAWKELTGLPFVYALWLTRENPAQSPLTETLRESKTAGLSALEKIVRDEARRADLPAPVVRRYLTQSIQYDLTAAHLDGAKRFKQYLVEDQLLPAPALKQEQA